MLIGPILLSFELKLSACDIRDSIKTLPGLWHLGTQKERDSNTHIQPLKRILISSFLVTFPLASQSLKVDSHVTDSSRPHVCWGWGFLSSRETEGSSIAPPWSPSDLPSQSHSLCQDGKAVHSFPGRHFPQHLPHSRKLPLWKETPNITLCCQGPHSQAK